MPDPRQAAFDILFPFEKQARAPHRLKADELLDAVLSSPQWATCSDDAGQDDTGQQRRFLTQLVYGILRHWFELNALINQHKPIKSIEPKVRTALRLGLYQLLWLDGVPDYAAVDSTLDLARKKRFSRQSLSVINAILRNTHSTQKQALPAISLLPEWWLHRLNSNLSEQELVNLIQSLQKPAPLSLRVNTLVSSIPDFQQALTQAGIGFHTSDTTLPEIITLNDAVGSPRHLPGYKQGWFSVQDISSARVAHWVAPKPHEFILDLCAAPGSKTAHLGVLMHQQSAGAEKNIIAVEPVSGRAQRLKDNLARLHLTQINVVESTAEQYNPEERFDKILVDAPCSGTGTIRKHPEILIQLRENQLADYARQQLMILNKAATLLKPGGQLIYSTCSLEADENRNVIDTFLGSYPAFRLDADEQRWIDSHQDGFYIARLCHQR